MKAGKGGVRPITFASPALIALLGGSLLVGCSSERAVDDYSDVRARLDTATETIAMPLDQFVLKGREARTVAHANALLMADCMAESGLDYPLALLDWDVMLASPDRRYGAFSVERAEEFGYDIPLDRALYEEQLEEQSRPASWWDAARNCAKVVETVPLGRLNSSATQSPADIAESVTYDLASETEGWREAVSDWEDCIAESGLEPDVGFAPVLPDDEEAVARIAIIDTTCKESTGFVQRVADIHAQFQAAYIAEHEAELQAWGRTVQGYLEQAEEIVATHGG